MMKKYVLGFVNDFTSCFLYKILTGYVYGST